MKPTPRFERVSPYDGRLSITAGTTRIEILCARGISYGLQRYGVPGTLLNNPKVLALGRPDCFASLAMTGLLDVIALDGMLSDRRREPSVSDEEFRNI